MSTSHCNDAGRLKKIGGPVEIGGNDLPAPPVGIGITDLPTIGRGAITPLASPVSLQRKKLQITDYQQILGSLLTT